MPSPTNVLLTPQEITNTFLAVMHEKIKFLKLVPRTYSKKFAVEGAKIGDTVDIRIAPEYVVTEGPLLVTQPTIERKVPFALNKWAQCSMEFTDLELTLKIDRFREKVIEGAAKKIAAKLESYCILTALQKITSTVNNIGQPCTYLTMQKARKMLIDNLVDVEDQKHAFLNTQDAMDVVTEMRTYQNPEGALNRQHKTGKLSDMIGFYAYETTYLANFQSGGAAAAGNYGIAAAVVGENITTLTTNVAATAASFLPGDIISIAGATRVHPETKDNTGVLMQFTVTEPFITGSGTALKISPPIYTSGPYQNINSTGIAAGAVITKLGGANAILKPSFMFDPQAFAFASADLTMPKGKDFQGRANFEGISVRIMKDLDMVTSNQITRVDTIYGFDVIQPKYAAKVFSN